MSRERRELTLKYEIGNEFNAKVAKEAKNAKKTIKPFSFTMERGLIKLRKRRDLPQSAQRE